MGFLLERLHRTVRVTIVDVKMCIIRKKHAEDAYGKPFTTYNLVKVDEFAPENDG